MVSLVSGSIFERRLIEKYVSENGVDPINGKELAVEQLIDVKGIFKSYLFSTIYFLLIFIYFKLVLM